MALLEELNGATEGSAGDAESLKAEHRRKRAKGANSKARKKKRAGESSSFGRVFEVLVLGAVVIGVGLWSRAAEMDRKSNSCKMTMSRPDYVPLPVAGYGDREGDTAGEIPGYGYRLVRYIDGKLPVRDRRLPSKPSGAPVLFVPGHLGSFKQARSLGSQAAEATLSASRRRLDIFALDLLEEWTALHGSMVWRQADFLNHAVEAILQLYEHGEGASSVTSVMIVGHSLGGLVARAAFTLPSYRVGSITNILTLGTPHNRAPWVMDYSVLSLYRCTDSLWRWHSSSPSASRFSSCWSRTDPTLEIAQSEHSVAQDKSDETVHETVERVADESAEAESQREACQVDVGGGKPNEDCAVPLVDRAPADSQTVDSPTVDSSAAEEPVGPVMGWGGAAGVDAESVLGNTVLLSVSGGPKDLMVHPSLCVTDGLGLEGQSVGLTTAVVEGCGFGVDHLALVWCKQLVSRVIATLSELERLDAMGAGAKERTRVAAGVLASLGRSSEVMDSEGAESDDYWPYSAGFDEAAARSEKWELVARSLVTDRSYLLIPAWVCMAALVLAAALTRGLSAKTAKAGALPPVQLLLAPETHFQWNTIKHLLLSLWTSVRAQGTPVVVALVTACSVLGIWAIGDDIEEYFPGAAERVLEVVCSVPGGAVIRRAGAMILIVVRLVGGATGSVVLVVNPFQGAGDALRLQPVKGITAVYFVAVAWMVVFVYLVAVLGATGNGIRRLFKNSPAPLAASAPLLRSRHVATAAAFAVAIAAHVETFSLPPTFRPLTLKGELSTAFMVLSLSLYALLISLALFPASSPAASTHQRLVLLLYAPAPAVLVGPQLAAVGVLLRRGGPHEPFVASGELALATLALLPIIASVWVARRGRPFPSPPSIRGFLAELRAQMDEEVARANGGSIRDTNERHETSGSSAAALAAAALERPHGHGACGKCLHADGGHGAIFVETDQERVAVGAGVTLGPGFRVVACDCPQRERATPSSWCEFCSCVCRVCGGCKEAMRALRGSRVARGRGVERGEGARLSDELGAAASVGLVSVTVLYVGLWAFGVRVMAAPCHCLFALALMGSILCGLRWGVQRDTARGLP